MTGSTGAVSSRFPAGFRVALRDDVRRLDDGRLLVGGSPLRAVRLSDAARTMLDGGAGRVMSVVDQPSALLAGRLLDGNLADPLLESTAVDPADITVVVPVRDRVEQLDRCLAALADLSVVVIDDASHDAAAVAQVVRRHGATLVALERNVGPAGARNAGLAIIDTPYVAFVDSDVVVNGTTLLELSGHLVDERVALVGPVVRGRPVTDRPRWFERYDAAASSLDLGARPCAVRPGAVVAWLPSACLVGRVTALGDGFEASMRVGEDVDLIWRLIGDGWVVRYEPGAVAHHDVRTSVRGWLGRKVLYGTGGADLARRHGDHGAPAVLAPVTAVAAAALLARRWWAVPLTAGAIAHSARALQRTLPDAPVSIALRLALEGTGWAVRQEVALLLRHWWPLGLLGALTSRHARRALISALALDMVLFLRERPGSGLLASAAGRRLDDVAYGTGLWLGAANARSTRCLRVRWLRPRGAAFPRDPRPLLRSR